MAKLAVVRVRGQVRVRYDVARALEQLNLRKKNHAVVVDDSPSVAGQLRKVQSFVTWGPVSEDVVKKLEPFRKGSFFALQPPLKGYGRKGVKMPFSQGGALGFRGAKINDLLLRMVR